MDGRRSRNDYTVGIVCALGTERTAVQAVLDEVHDILPVFDGDQTLYLLGRIGKLDVVVACLPAGSLGKVEAATLAGFFSQSYTNLEFVLMVGIGGGVPLFGVRLGDVVVSVPTDGNPGLVEYDLGRQADGFQRVGAHKPPSRIALNAVQSLRSSQDFGNSHILRHVQNVIQNHPGLDSRFTQSPDAKTDVVFESAYPHQPGSDCHSCDKRFIVPRLPAAATNSPQIFYGNIASGDKVMKDAAQRDAIAIREKIICFEMEAAGLSTRFDYLVIRGICDYADSHKNKDWQPWAAMTAAVYAKELLLTYQNGVAPSRSIKWRDSGFHSYADLDATSRASHQAPDMFSSQMTSTPPKRHPDAEMRASIRTATGASTSSSALADSSTCLSSLVFSGMKDRLRNIDPPLAQTCSWLQQHTTYVQWMTQSGLLWLNGKPGSGKSTLVKHMLESDKNIVNDHSEVQTLQLAYFFYTAGSSLQKSFLGFLRSLVHQLVRASGECLEAFVSRCSSRCADEGCTMSKWQWHLHDLQSDLEYLLAIALQQHRIVIAVDALDESETEACARNVEKYLTQLLRKFKDEDRSLHILVACRPFPAIMRQHDFMIKVDECNSPDIDTAITAHLGIQGLHGFPSIEKEIQQRASGVFQWVNLVVERISEMDQNGEGPNAMLREITNLPDELRGIYSGLINRTSRSTATDALYLMQWVCYAARPLSLDELRVVLVLERSKKLGATIEDCIRINDGCINADQMERRMRALSKGLLEVKQNDKTKMVQFIHQSAFEFMRDDGLALLESMQEGWRRPHPDHGISAHVRLTEVCIRHFLIDEIVDRSKVQSPQLDSQLQEQLKYAVSHWIDHARVWDQSGLSTIDLIHALQPSQFQTLQLWRKLCDATGSPIVPQSSKKAILYRSYVDLIYLAIEEGLCSIIDGILPSSTLELKDDKYTTPSTSTRDVGALTLHQADLAALRNHTGGFLGLAAAMNRFEPLKTLISKNLDVNAASEDGLTALHWATKVSSLQAVHMLLEAGASVQTRDPIYGRSPLHEAAKTSSVDIIALLASKADNVDVKDFYGLSPLHLAAFNGHCEVACLLLDRGADVNCAELVAELWAGAEETLEEPSKPVWATITPLLLAVQCGEHEMVRCLVQRGARISDYGEDGHNPLTMAVSRENGTMIETLLELGCQPDQPDAAGVTPLSHAVQVDDVEILQTLLKAGAEVHIPDSAGNLPIHFAAGHASGRMLDTILEITLYPDCVNDRGKSALHIAAWQGKLENIMMLVANGLNLETCDFEGQTPLTMAVKAGSVEVVEFLISMGASLDVHDFEGRGLLHIAAYYGQSKVLRLIMGRVGDLDEPDDTGSTAVQLAQRNGYAEVVKLLLENGATASGSDKDTKAEP
ncbi:Ankyrin repeat-containing protein 2 [Elsinoe fawcettii]|nr:Ankyrin repeat-containing protein 2 [Elsinoe fawcettii]